MTPFGHDPQPLSAPVFSVADPAGTVSFDHSLIHVRSLPSLPAWGMAPWSNGYQGDVYTWNQFDTFLNSAGDFQVTLTLPAHTLAFYFYVQPMSDCLIHATAQDGTTASVELNAYTGTVGPSPDELWEQAQYFGFYATEGATVETITVAAWPFAVGEFGISPAHHSSFHRCGPCVPYAVDPMSLILSASAYLIWVEEHNPHVPKPADIEAALRGLAPEEQSAALARARALVAFGESVEHAIAAIPAERLRAMTPEGKNADLARARLLVAYGHAVEEALRTIRADAS
jgi:hypothetical protein